ncbi:16S rRNA (guanine(527)-N(7))-methyltransferase RsmG [Paracoccus sp. (in: a-proteobacteria)]|uniref:16S rRNA (guanine(527)-N(7))-methyltransferase RsmG n=1 Tax=Paracoccus sp. TaxID=267 RepID=UPI0026DFC930|nr:16S rRNA (guanine(527)-N(7))-methyltransferase RsmG [Paracoccus sp. (in: a-proteobacteria)]MDO5647501.1 16S rRNA (guanine(527)-N(7))-methyltransferase RsmG [Paracoccus sp. (in: a-proteobacteria)]
MNVSRETEARLAAYAALIRKWNPRINLVAPSTLTNLETRHIADSLQIATITGPVSGHWVDLGSGGGLPGLVMAIAHAEHDIRFTLIESDQRKSTFLRTVIRELGLKNAQVIAQRIEQADPQNADHISARALASLANLMPFLHRHMTPDGHAWLMKGENWQAELAEAAQEWHFRHQSFPSQTNPSAAILKITKVSHV